MQKWQKRFRYIRVVLEAVRQGRLLVEETASELVERVLELCQLIIIRSRQRFFKARSQMTEGTRATESVTYL